MEEAEAQFIVVYGRRRVGKTFLIESFFERKFDFSFTGAYNRPTSAQLQNFSTCTVERIKMDIIHTKGLSF